MFKKKRNILYGLSLLILFGIVFYVLFSLQFRKPQNIVPLNINVLTYHYDNQRTGSNNKERLLTLDNVNQYNFGKLFSMPVDGAVYAQPLYKDGSIFIATENNSIYSFNAKDGTLLWKKSFIDSTGTTAIPYQDVKTDAIYPEIGITGTPVIDDKTNTLYVVSEHKRIGLNTPKYFQLLHAIDTASGKEKFGGPITISASIKNKDKQIISFNPLIQLQRSALLLENGIIYIAWGSNGDIGPYHGWIMAYDATDIRNQLGVFNDTPNGERGGIWMSGGGISSDGKYIYVSSGNGTFDPKNNNYGDSVIKLILDKTNKQFIVADYFSPSNQAYLESRDLDLSASKVIVAPKLKITQMGSTLITGDKSGNIYILDSENLGKFNSVDKILQKISIDGFLLNNLSFSNDSIYISGNNMIIKSFIVENGRFKKSSQSSNIFVLGGNPVISSNGRKNAILWILDNSSFRNSGNTILYSYNANNLSKKLYDSTQAGVRDIGPEGVKFTCPTVANGYVYVPGNKEVSAYGILK